MNACRRPFVGKRLLDTVRKIDAEMQELRLRMQALEEQWHDFKQAVERQPEQGSQESTFMREMQELHLRWHHRAVTLPRAGRVKDHVIRII